MTTGRRCATGTGKQIKRSLLKILSVLIISLVLVSCSESSTDAGNDDEPTPNEVQMVGLSFSPSTLQVSTGTTVTWKNTTSVVHTVTSGTGGNHDGLFDSGNMQAGAEFSFTFSEAGTFPYYCIPHLNSGMTGTIVVVADNN
jgi:plastocyanin